MIVCRLSCAGVALASSPDGSNSCDLVMSNGLFDLSIFIIIAKTSLPIYLHFLRQ